MGNSWEDRDLESEAFINIFDGDAIEDTKSSKGTLPKKLSAGRIVAMVFIGIFFSLLIVGLVNSLYTRYIRFPDEQERVWENSRLYALQGFNDEVNSMSVDIEGSYIMQELPYANDNKDREAFMKYVLSSVKYSTDLVNKKNVYGNDLVDKETGKILTENSWLSSGEEATLSYIDYNSIVFEKEAVEWYVEGINLTANDIDYRNKLTDIFCQFIYNIPVEELPLVSVGRVPEFSVLGEGYSVAAEEDIYLDKVLFSSNELYSCFERFAECVASVTGAELEVTADYREWESLSEAEKVAIDVPPKYGKYSIAHTWCGAYYLQNEYKGNSSTTPQLGDGSKEQPASIGTPVITYVIETDENGAEVKYPIRVTMVEYGVSQKALDWFQAKDIQNRGYDVTSELQYCYYVFEITNLSDRALTIKDNSSLCDSMANCSSRTGTMYGLQEYVTLDPEETGRVESWSRSTELNLKYVIWGKDFARRQEPVWFRVLAGDLEDPTWEKGVYTDSSKG